MPRAIRERLQLERLRATLRWSVEHVAFHRERLGATTIGALSDLARLPFVRKTDLREQYPFGLLAVPRREVARIHASSGTKGKPTVAAYSAGDLDVWREVMARALIAAGARRGDLLHIAFGYGLFTGGLGFHDGAERVGMTVVPVSSGNTARHHLLLQDFRPEVIAATPSFALHLAETLAEQGGKPRELGLRVGVFGAEPWTDGIGPRSSGRSTSSLSTSTVSPRSSVPASPASARRATGFISPTIISCRRSSIQFRARPCRPAGKGSSSSPP